MTDTTNAVPQPDANDREALLDEIHRLRAVACNAIEVIRITISGLEKNSPVPVDLLGIWHSQLREELSGNAGLTRAEVGQMLDGKRHDREALLDEIDRLREALKPFGDLAVEGDDREIYWGNDLKLGDLRRARAALNEKDTP